jgi:hypothetical protein
MVFALETYCPADDGFSAARIEEEVVVTADGPRILTLFPAQDLVVANRSRRSHGRHSHRPLPRRQVGAGLVRRPVRRVRPVHREVIAAVADGTVEDAIAAVDAADAAAAGWAATAPGPGRRSCAARSS